jgi:sirohydrochlorin ferrochelatase
LSEDIPKIIKECVVDYPNVKVVMGEPLGVDARLADILIDRISG